jgi:hypothetical protein
MITGGADATILGRYGSPVLVAEAMSRFDALDRSWAARTFRNLYAHGSVPEVPFFLLALPDAFHLWRDPGQKALKAFVEGRTSALGEPEQVPPDFSVPAWEIVRPYLGRPGGRDPDPREVSSYAMRMVLGAFLADVLNARYVGREEAPKNLWWLFDSGLYDTMRGGHFAGSVAG